MQFSDVLASISLALSLGHILKDFISRRPRIRIHQAEANFVSLPADSRPIGYAVSIWVENLSARPVTIYSADIPAQTEAGKAFRLGRSADTWLRIGTGTSQAEALTLFQQAKPGFAASCSLLPATLPPLEPKQIVLLFRTDRSFPVLDRHVLAIQSREAPRNTADTPMRASRRRHAKPSSVPSSDSPQARYILSLRLHLSSGAKLLSCTVAAMD